MFCSFCFCLCFLRFVFVCVFFVLFLLFVVVLSGEPKQKQSWSTANYVNPLVILLLDVPRRLFCFGPIVVLDVVCGYVLLLLLGVK